MAQYITCSTPSPSSSRASTPATKVIFICVLMTLLKIGTVSATSTLEATVSGDPSVLPCSQDFSAADHQPLYPEVAPITLRDYGNVDQTLRVRRKEAYAPSADGLYNGGSMTERAFYLEGDRRADAHAVKSTQQHARLARRLHQRTVLGTASNTRRSTKPHRTSQRISRQNSHKTYALVDSHEGASFFDGWDFFDYSDPTHGMITYVSSADAFSSGLAYVQGDNVAIMTVDNKTTLYPGEYRKSVRITSKKAYNNGLFIFDILRAPHGCAVWPAAWLVGPSWPNGGEIDVLEGVHENLYNQMTLHTASGCTLDATKSTIEGAALVAGINPTELFTGKILATDCDAYVNSNAGCGILDSDDRSYGAGLNNNGGGVYATLWDATGVRIWFFSRDSVPADITAKTPDPTTWGSPKAFWSSNSCAQSFFSDLSIVFDTVLGGDWAGPTFTSAGCPGNLADYIANADNFANANWAVNSVRVYQ